MSRSPLACCIWVDWLISVYLSFHTLSSTHASSSRSTEPRSCKSRNIQDYRQTMEEAKRRSQGKLETTCRSATSLHFLHLSTLHTNMPSRKKSNAINANTQGIVTNPSEQASRIPPQALSPRSMEYLKLAVQNAMDAIYLRLLHHSHHSHQVKTVVR